MTAAPGPPLDPAPAEARQWLEDELSKGIYHRPPSLLDRLLEWLWELLNGPAGEAVLPPWQALGIGLAVALVVALAAWRVAGPLRRRRAAERHPGGVLAGEKRSGAQLLAAAQARAAAGDWRRASLLAFQAIARRLEERAILDPQPGRTARELARHAGLRLPALTEALGQAAAHFDAVAYGAAQGQASVYRFLIDLGQRADQTKPDGLEAAAPAQAGQLAALAAP
ncbi:MAG: DUF4129 domain-containing protein [Bifidobacteriaceae bacterium]|nr:DUF4129 domain-containing protein [Bifidobacteriaceae bacterium]